jgi:hypothetical protein
MNQEERDELRKKHREGSWHVGDTVQETWCIGCAPEAIPAYPYEYPFPCDVIRVLDAWENERNMVALTDIMREQGYPE